MPAMRTPHPLTADGAFFVAPRGDRLADSDAGTTLRMFCQVALFQTYCYCALHQWQAIFHYFISA